ncbi:MAG: acyl carrier protein [Oligoflexia bacterium]|nr:acyl carrier protein [Oligoflexia bacterium]
MEKMIYEKMQSVFVDIFDDNNIKLTPQMTAKDIDDWDSLNHINLIVSLEKEFSIKFAASEVQQLENVGAMVKLIEKKLNFKNSN